MSPENEETKNEETKLPEAITLSNLVKDKIAQSNATVVEKVVDSLVNKEIRQRANDLENALDLRKKTKSELDKIKPDQKSVDADGKMISETYSEEKFKSLKQTKERLAKIDNAINRAINEGQYDKIKEVINQK